METSLTIISLNLKRIPVYIELGFWNLIIFLLSESSIVRSSIKFIAPYIPEQKLGINPFTALLYIVTGLTFGFVIGIIGSLYLPF
jgi:hypothetical protein